MVSNHNHRPLIIRALAAAAICFGPMSQGISADGAEPGVKPDPAAPPPAEEVKKLTPEEFDHLVDDLSSDDFATRENAQKRLIEGSMAGGLAETLRQRFAKVDNPEVKLRLRRVLYQVAKAEFLGRPKAFLGIQMQDSVVVGGKTGREMILSVMVLSIIPGSAAEKQGIEPGDHILTVDGRGFEAIPSTEFKGMVGARAAGDEVRFRLRRGGVLSDKKVVLGEMPADLMLSTVQSEVAFDSYFQLWLERGGKIQRP